MSQNEMQFSLLDGQICVPAELLELIPLKEAMNQQESQIFDHFAHFYTGDSMFEFNQDQDQDFLTKTKDVLINDFSDTIQLFLQKLISMGIYDKTLSDYLSQNDGIKKLEELTDTCWKVKKDLYELYQAKANQQVLEFSEDAYQQVNGVGYGVVTNSISQLIAHSITNQIAATHQANKAEKTIATAADRIYRENLSAFVLKWDESNQTFIQSACILIGYIAKCLFTQIVDDLILAGKFPSHIKNYIDEEKSQGILNNINLTPDKKGICRKALEVCPYDQTVYETICTQKLLDEQVVQFAIGIHVPELLAEAILSNLTQDCKNLSACDKEAVHQKMGFYATLTHKSTTEIYQFLFKDRLSALCEALYKLEHQSISKNSIDKLYQRYHVDDKPIQKSFVQDYVNNIINIQTYNCLVELCGKPFLDSFLQAEYRGFSSMEETQNQYTEKILALIDKKRTDRLKNKAEGERLRAMIREQEALIEKNKRKLWGEGARQKKQAQDRITELYQKISELEN